MKKIVCGECHTEHIVNEGVWHSRRKTGAGLPWPCAKCGADLYRVGSSPRRGASDSQRRSRAQEKRVAAREGGRRQPGSGAVDGFEGDVRSAGRYRGECKLTRASSYSLKLADLLKLERQASSGELPVLDLEFQCSAPFKRYVIMPEWAYESLMADAGRRGDATDPDDS